MNLGITLLLLIFPAVVLLVGLAIHGLVQSDRGGLMERRGHRP